MPSKIFFETVFNDASASNSAIIRLVPNPVADHQAIESIQQPCCCSTSQSRNDCNKPNPLLAQRTGLFFRAREDSHVHSYNTSSREESRTSTYDSPYALASPLRARSPSSPLPPLTFLLESLNPVNSLLSQRLREEYASIPLQVYMASNTQRCVCCGVLLEDCQHRDVGSSAQADRLWGVWYAQFIRENEEIRLAREERERLRREQGGTGVTGQQAKDKDEEERHREEEEDGKDISGEEKKEEECGKEESGEGEEEDVESAEGGKEEEEREREKIKKGDEDQEEVQHVCYGGDQGLRRENEDDQEGDQKEKEEEEQEVSQTESGIRTNDQGINRNRSSDDETNEGGENDEDDESDEGSDSDDSERTVTQDNYERHAIHDRAIAFTRVADAEFESLWRSLRRLARRREYTADLRQSMQQLRARIDGLQAWDPLERLAYPDEGQRLRRDIESYWTVLKNAPRLRTY